MVVSLPRIKEQEFALERLYLGQGNQHWLFDINDGAAICQKCNQCMTNEGFHATFKLGS
jgi:hypothetical protein